MIHYKLRKGKNDLAEVLGKKTFSTPVRGHYVEDNHPSTKSKLEKNGDLTVYPGFVWDFGSGAVDTPDMIEPSLVHDAFCHMTDNRYIPWSCRKVADKLFYTMLRERGCGWFR